MFRMETSVTGRLNIFHRLDGCLDYKGVPSNWLQSAMVLKRNLKAFKLGRTRNRGVSTELVFPRSRNQRGIPHRATSHKNLSWKQVCWAGWKSSTFLMASLCCKGLNSHSSEWCRRHPEVEMLETQRKIEGSPCNGQLDPKVSARRRSAWLTDLIPWPSHHLLTLMCWARCHRMLPCPSNDHVGSAAHFPVRIWL